MQKTYYINNEIDQDLYNFYLTKPFTIKALNYPDRTHTLTLHRYNNSTTNYAKLQYSFDGNVWVNLDFAYSMNSEVSVTFQEKIYLRANHTADYINNNPSFYFNNGIYAGRYWYLTVNANDKFALEGNIAYLIDYLGRIPATLSECILGDFIAVTSNVGSTSAIFDSVKNLVLPYTTLSNYCYYRMFMSNNSNFSNITKLPLMPKTLTLGISCFTQMFKGCTALKELPIINTSNFPVDCCAYMFEGCSSMTISTTETSIAKNVFRLPYEGTATKESGSFRRMFGDTVPIVNTTYYTNCKVK